jgi:hypothetical protein
MRSKGDMFWLKLVAVDRAHRYGFAEPVCPE